jgi:RNA polymerase subunit RPABC4/transcription elongation factor Spt4
MPTYKHPCPYCGQYIDRVVAACPFCGQVDPFAPKRCKSCRRVVEDPAWVVCPSCGASLLPPPPVEAGTAPGAAAPAPGAAAPGAAPAARAAAPAPGAAAPAAGGAAPAGGGSAPAQPAAPGITGDEAAVAAAAAALPAPDVRPPLYQDPDAPTATPQSAGKCSGCGASLPAGARFCTVCGTVAG